MQTDRQTDRRRCQYPSVPGSRGPYVAGYTQPIYYQQPGYAPATYYGQHQQQVVVVDGQQAQPVIIGHVHSVARHTFPAGCLDTSPSPVGNPFPDSQRIPMRTPTLTLTSTLTSTSTRT